MKFLILLSTFFISASLSAQSGLCGIKATATAAAGVKDLVGKWSGQIIFNGRQEAITVDVRLVKGEYLAYIQDGLSGEVLSGVVSICAPQKFHFSGKLRNGQLFRYSQRLAKGKLSGSYQVGDACSLDKPIFDLSRSL